MAFRFPILVFALALLPVVSLAGSLHLGSIPEYGIGEVKPKVREFLPDDIGQPFEMRDLQPLRTLGDLARYHPQGFWDRHLSFLDLVLLKDYLDEDSVPSSPVIPSVETSPMVCSVRLSANKLAVTKTQTEQFQGYGERVVETTYAIDPSMFYSMVVSAHVAFPFRYTSPRKQHNYRCQCVVKFFIADTYGTSIRAGFINERDELNATADWDGYWSTMTDHTITFVSPTVNLPLSVNDDVTAESMTQRVNFDGFQAPHATFERPLLKIARRYATDSYGHSSSTPFETQYQVGFFPYDSSWNTALTSWRSPNNQSPSNGGWFRASYAVWVRVIDEEDNTVDVVPATFLDDGIDRPHDPTLDNVLTSLCGDHLPLLRFVSDGEFAYSETELGNMGSIRSAEFSTTTYFAVDPRYNHAPENWISTGYTSSFGRENWYEAIRNSLGVDGRDSDPFMFTSDRGYLQSVSELCNLPNVGGLTGGTTGELFNESSRRFDGRVRGRADDTADWKFEWKTYSFSGDSRGDDPSLYNLLGTTGERNVRGGISDCGGIQDVDAAIRLLSNTPSDWYVAGTNEQQRYPASPIDFLRNTFNQNYGRGELDDNALEGVVSKIVSKINGSFARGGGDWRTAYDALDWFSPSDPYQLIGVDLPKPLMEVERKFLHSYWRGLLSSWQLGSYDLVLPNDAMQVSEWEFAGDEALVSVTFPLHLSSVRRNAFKGCVNLKKVIINSQSAYIDREAFAGCSNIGTVILGPDLQMLDWSAFRDCANLSNICVSAARRELPLGAMSMYNLSDTFNFTILSDAPVVPERFNGGYRHMSKWRITLEEGIVGIGRSAFERDDAITEVKFPSTLGDIGDYAFNMCSGIKSIEIPAGVSNIGQVAFHSIDVSKITVDAGNRHFCIADGVLYGLEDGIKRRILQASADISPDYQIPETVRVIDPMAFYGCRKLRSLRIPSGVNELGEQTFVRCLELTSLTIPASVNKIDARALSGLSFDCVVFESGSSFYVDGEALFYKVGASHLQLVCVKSTIGAEYTIPDAVSSIQDSALSGLSNLRTVICGAGLEKIGQYAFSSCSQLESVRFNEGLMEIDKCAFSECANLKAIIFPASLNKLGSMSFRSCVNVSRVVFKGDVPEGIAESLLLDNYCMVWYPLDYASAYEGVIPPAQFAGYTDNLKFTSIEDVAESFAGFPTVVASLKSDDEVLGFGEFLSDCGASSAGSMSVGQKTWVYQSFKLAEIMTAPQLFEEEPVLKIDDIELTGGNLSLTISLTAGAEAIQLAKDKLAEKIRVGTTLGNITGKPTIVASPAADGTSLTFTITPPVGNQGFVRVLID